MPVQRPPTVPLDVVYPNLPVLNSCAVEEELLVHGGVTQPPPPPPAPRPPPPAYRPPSAGSGTRGGRGANGRARGGRRFVELTPAAHINAIARQLMASTKEAFGVDWDDVGGTRGERSEGTGFSTKTVQEDTRRNGAGERHSTVPEHGAESALHGGDARYNVAADTGDASSMLMTPAAAAVEAVSSDDVCGGSGGALDWTQEGRRDGQLHAALVDSISDDAAVSVENNYVTLCSTSVGDGQRSDVNALRVYASKNGASRGSGSDTITLYASVDAGGEVGVARGTADLSIADSETTSASEGEEWRRGDQEAAMSMLSEGGAWTMSSTLSELAALKAGGSDVVAGSSSVEVADAEPVGCGEGKLAAPEMVATTMPVGGSEVPSDNRSAWARMLEDCPSADVKVEPSDDSETPWSQSASMDPVGALLSSPGTGHRSTSPSPSDTPSTAVSQDSEKPESSDHHSTDRSSRKKSSKKKRRRTPSKSDKTKSSSRDAAGTVRTTPTKKLGESSSSGRSQPSSEKARKDSPSSGHRSRSKTKHDSKNGRTTPQKSSKGKSSPRKPSSHRSSSSRSSSQKSSSHKSSSHKSSQCSSLRKSSSHKSSPPKSSSKRSSPRKSSAQRSSFSHKPSGSKSSSQKPSPGKSTPCRSSPRKPSFQKSSEKSSSHKSSSHKTSSQKSSVPTHARDKGSPSVKKHSKTKDDAKNGKTTPHASSDSGSHLSAFDKLLLDSSSPKQRPKPKATAASCESSDSDAVAGGESLSAFDRLLLDSPSTSRLVKSKNSANNGSATPLKPTGQKSTPSKSSDSWAKGSSLPSFDQLLQGTSSAPQPLKTTCSSDELASSVVHGSTSVWADMLGDCPSADHPAQKEDTSNIAATSFGEASGSGEAPGARRAPKKSSGEGDGGAAGGSTIGALLSTTPAASRSDGGRSLLKELLADCPSADADQLTLKKLLEDCLSARPSRGRAAGTSGAGGGGSSAGGGRSVLKELLADCPSADPRRLRLKQLLANCPSADPGRLRLKELLADCPSADSEPEVVVLAETQGDPGNPSSGNKSGTTDDNQPPPRDER
ncbi:serine/arginine repetitive matrix protein 2-like isoform X1 [Amphibalanus amphitrite]|uniref:serine/arginine repetitive matrix protein 2-like isoform X1 n=1 Tax=Amphibalanus amphitrite TaxID=1232801 RepID=UPI001C91ACDB|nr:serine/arginine repetitive matrix protein 2-like isoform X1 [Amphibalanus amphitrite]